MEYMQGHAAKKKKIIIINSNTNINNNVFQLITSWVRAGQVFSLQSSLSRACMFACISKDMNDSKCSRARVKQFNGGHSGFVGALLNLAQQAAIAFMVCS